MFKSSAVYLILSVALSVFAFADTDTLTPTDDARVWQFVPYGNYGNSVYFNVGVDFSHFNTLIKFDLSPYMGNTITQAKIALWVYDDYGDFPTDNIIITMNDTDWDEGSVYWNSKPGFNGVNYVNAPAVRGWWDVYVTSWVQDIVDGTEPNYGFQIYQDDSDETSFYMYSKENSVNQPYMELTYSSSAIECASLGEIKAVFK